LTRIYRQWRLWGLLFEKFAFYLALMNLHSLINFFINHYLNLALDVSIKFVKNEFCASLETLGNLEIDSIIYRLEAIFNRVFSVFVLEEGVVEA
jgi:hypothetical protein